MSKTFQIITKQEFTSLYRFGQIPFDDRSIIDENEGTKEFEEALIECFITLPYFSGDEEYLIISLTELEETQKIISIENVREIIPLTAAAKNSYELKFDSRITFSSPRFEYLTEEVEQRIDIQDKKNGAKVLWKIVTGEVPEKKYVEEKYIEEAYIARRNGKKSSEITSAFFTHLLVYERYEFFPNSDLGYFYDVGEIFAHSKGKPTFKGSSYYNHLESIKKEQNNQKLSNLITEIEKSEEVDAFKKQCSDGAVRHYISAILFLMFKDDLIDKEGISEKVQKSVEHILEKEDYQEELKYALYLTGIFFGYEKFYSDYYDNIGLSIFGYKPSLEETKKLNTETLDKTEKSQSITKDENIEKERVQKEKVTSKDSKLHKQTDKERIREQILEILNRAPSKKIKISKDMYHTFKKILEPLIKKENPFQEDYFNVLREEFSNDFEFVSKKVIQLKTEPELKFDN